jgi:ankyrin repeat protein
MESRISILLCLLAVSGVNVNPIVQGRNLFMFAVQVGSLELIERLLEFNETKVNEYNQRGTGLMIALEKGFKEISVKLIEDDRIDVNYVNMEGISLLESAIEGGNCEVLSRLISSPRFKAGFHNVHSALKLSIKRKSHDMTVLLLDSPIFDVDVTRQVGQRRPDVSEAMVHLRWAVDNMVRTQFVFNEESAGAEEEDATQVEEERMMAEQRVIMAAERLHYETIADRQLLPAERAAMMEKHQDRIDLIKMLGGFMLSGQTPEGTWHILEKAKAVTVRQIDPNEPGSVLETAIMEGNDDVIDMVLKHQSFERCQRDQSLFLLKLSCVYNRIRSVEFLLRHLEEDVNVWIGEESLLTIAITSRSLGVVQFIVSDSRFSVDRTNTRRTLRSAIESVDRHEVRSESIEAALRLPGIDVNKSFKDGFTALTWAAQETAFQDVKLIESRFRELGIRMNNVTMERNIKQVQKNAGQFLIVRTIEILLGSGRGCECAPWMWSDRFDGINETRTSTTTNSGYVPQSRLECCRPRHPRHISHHTRKTSSIPQLRSPRLGPNGAKGRRQSG